jgi:TonB family protein
MPGERLTQIAMTLTIKDAPEVGGSPKPAASAQASEGASGQSPRTNPVCLEVPIVVRSLPGEDGKASGTAGPSRQDGRSVIVFDNGGVLRVANPLPAGQKVILSNQQGRDVVCRIVSGRSLPNVKGYIEVEFIEPVSDFWHIHQTTQPAVMPSPAVPAIPVPVIPVPALQQPSPAAKASAPSVAPRVTALPKELPKEMETGGEAISGGAPTFDDVAGLVLMSPAGSKREKKIEAPSAPTISKNKIESAPRPAELSKPAAYNKTSAISDLDFEEISAPSRPETISPALPGEVFSGDVFGRTMQVSATSSTVTLSGDSRGRMPLILGGAALLFAGLGAGYYFTHQANSPAQPVAVTSQASPKPADASTGSQPASVSKPIAEQTPAQVAEPVVAASAGVTSPAPLDSQNVRQRTSAAETKQPDLANARRPAISNLKMRSPSASGKSLANLPDGSPADSVDIAPTMAPGAGTPGTFSARTETRPAPPPAPVASVVNSASVVPAKLISSTRPAYPPMAKSSNVQGNVVIAANINENGVVTTAKAVSGPIALRQAGVDAVMQWKYSPALTSGRPTPTQTTVTIEFRLN